MSYYNILLLTDAEKKVYTITTPFRKYEYNHIPMGFFIATDIFHEQMGTLMYDLDPVKVYLDNFLVITSGSFEEHLAKVEGVIKQLQ